MKKILISVFLLIGLIFWASTARAAVIYPIAELGNCANAVDCFNYCDDPQNNAVCWSYGKFIMQKQVLGDSVATDGAKPTGEKGHVVFPIAELGNCANAAACKAYCTIAANHDACSAFGNRMGLLKHVVTTPSLDPKKLKFLQDAKTALGCDGMQACSLFCSREENREKCKAFAESEGLTTGSSGDINHSTIPPTLFDITQQELGCDSATSCKLVCSKPENLQKCKEFAQKHNLYTNQTAGLHPLPAISGTIKPTGGIPAGAPLSTCKSADECEQYCKLHPGVCPGFPKPTTIPSPTLGVTTGTLQVSPTIVNSGTSE